MYVYTSIHTVAWLGPVPVFALFLPLSKERAVLRWLCRRQDLFVGQWHNLWLCGDEDEYGRARYWPPNCYWPPTANWSLLSHYLAAVSAWASSDCAARKPTNHGVTDDGLRITGGSREGANDTNTRIHEYANTRSAAFASAAVYAFVIYALRAAMPQRARAASSVARASTQRAPLDVVSFFQNGAWVLR